MEQDPNWDASAWLCLSDFDIERKRSCQIETSHARLSLISRASIIVRIITAGFCCRVFSIHERPRCSRSTVSRHPAILHCCGMSQNSENRTICDMHVVLGRVSNLSRLLALQELFTDCGQNAERYQLPSHSQNLPICMHAYEKDSTEVLQESPFTS